MKRPPPVVVDTNVLVSGLITADEESPVCLILDAMLAGRIRFLLSADLLDEYRRVVLRLKIKKLHGLGEGEIDKILTEVASNGIWRETTGQEVAPDPGDSHLWRLLRTQPGSLLVTGNRLLLEQPPEFASVMSPATFVREFDGDILAAVRGGKRPKG
jgi:putative PIN family toxin of toxin-antitoxin system